MSQSRSQNETGKLYIVGTGPGSVDMLTERAKEAIRESEYIIGNRMYMDLLEGTRAQLLRIQAHDRQTAHRPAQTTGGSIPGRRSNRWALP